MATGTLPEERVPCATIITNKNETINTKITIKNKTANITLAGPPGGFYCFCLHEVDPKRLPGGDLFEPRVGPFSWVPLGGTPKTMPLLQ